MYEDVTWTTEQVDFALNMIFNKIIEGKPVTIEADKYTKGSFTVRTGNAYISLGRYDGSRSVFMILDKASGSYDFKFGFWADKDVKKSYDKLMYYLRNQRTIELTRKAQETQKYKTDVAMKSLFAAFPEAVTQEFEKIVLGDKDGKGEES